MNFIIFIVCEYDNLVFIQEVKNYYIMGLVQAVKNVSISVVPKFSKMSLVFMNIIKHIYLKFLCLGMYISHFVTLKLLTVIKYPISVFKF